MYQDCDIATEDPAVTLFLKSGFILTPLKIINGVIYAPVALQHATTVTFSAQSAPVKEFTSRLPPAATTLGGLLFRGMQVSLML
jgi:hypothetical protein